MRERLNRAVSKTVVLVRAPRVRIPLSPLYFSREGFETEPAPTNGRMSAMERCTPVAIATGTEGANCQEAP